MMKSICIAIAFCLLAIFATFVTPASASAGVPGGKQIIKAIGRFLGKEAGATVTEQAVKKMTRDVGEELIERTAKKMIREGGEKSLIEVGELVAKNGPNVIRALDNVPDAVSVLRLLKELPAEDVAKAASRLATDATGQEIAKLSTKYGVKVLKAEVKHPGVGMIFANALGDEGAELSLKLTTDQAIQVARHVDDIAKLPATQQKQLLKFASDNTDRFVSYVGNFAEKNSGKILFTAAGTTVILANGERIFGGDEVVTDENGNPYVVSKPGVLGRLGDKSADIVAEPVRWTVYLFGGIIAFVLISFAGLKFWKHLQTDRLAVAAARNSAAQVDTIAVQDVDSTEKRTQPK